MCIVTGLNVHFIKSCRATRLDEAELDERGIRYDRRWMIVDENGKFVTQREHPELARVVPRLTEKALTIEVEGDANLRVIVPQERWANGDLVPVTVWKHDGMGVHQGRAASEFFSTHLHTPVRLIWMPEEHVRLPNRLPTGVNTRVGYADGYPFLLVTEQSLTELNRHLPAEHDPIPMERFRPNIVVDGCEEPWEEERWAKFTINSITFYGVKPCDRCPITQTDQRTGERASKEPLRTLSKIHRDGNAALFGANLIHADLGKLRVGARIENLIFGERPML